MKKNALRIDHVADDTRHAMQLAGQFVRERPIVAAGAVAGLVALGAWLLLRR